jgi:hypothetical protein
VIDPNSISNGITSFASLSIFIAFILFVSTDNRGLGWCKRAADFFYEKLYYPVYKTIQYILVATIVVLFIMSFRAEYPKKITHYICDNFIECVIPRDSESMQFYDTPYPYNRKEFIKLNSYKLDHNGRKDMRRIEGYFKEYPYSF